MVGGATRTIASRSHAAGLVVRTHRREKYGRWLATLMSADGACMNTALIEVGHAAPYGGTGPPLVSDPLSSNRGIETPRAAAARRLRS